MASPTSFRRDLKRAPQAVQKPDAEVPAMCSLIFRVRFAMLKFPTVPVAALPLWIFKLHHYPNLSLVVFVDLGPVPV
jgi:hypothetical protein